MGGGKEPKERALSKRCCARSVSHKGQIGLWRGPRGQAVHRVAGRETSAEVNWLLIAAVTPSGMGQWHGCILEGGGGGSPDGLFAQQEREPIRGRPAVRGKRTYGGRPGQCLEEQGTWATQKHSEAGYGRPVDRGAWAAKTVKRPPQQPAQPPIRQLLGAADAQTAHPATFSTAPTHQSLGSANAETTPAGAPAAAADRTQRPDATCEGKTG